MIEIINIILLIVYIYFLTLFPLNKKYFKIKKDKKLLSNLDIATANLTLHMLILLIASYLPIKLIYIFYFQIIIGFTFMTKLFLSKKKNLIDINYIIKFSFLFIITFILSVDLVSNLTLGWDSQFRWIIKALNFYQGNSINNLINFTDPEYPHFGAYLWAYFWKISILDYEYAGRIFYITLYVISIVSFCEVFDTDNFKSLIISLLFIIIGYRYLPFNGYQDIVIFSFLLLVSKNLFLILNQNITHKIYYIILFTNLFLVSWIKTEAMLYSIFLLIILFFIDKNKNIKLLAFSLIIFIILTKIITYNLLDFPILLQGETYNKSITEFDFEILFNRFLLVSKFYFLFLFDNILMFISLISLFYLMKTNFNYQIVKFLTIFFIFNIAFIFGSHLFMNLQNLDYWITHTIPRFMIQTTGIYIMAIALIYNIKLKKIIYK